MITYYEYCFHIFLQKYQSGCVVRLKQVSGRGVWVCQESKQQPQKKQTMQQRETYKVKTNEQILLIIVPAPIPTNEGVKTTENPKQTKMPTHASATAYHNKQSSLFCSMANPVEGLKHANLNSLAVLFALYQSTRVSSVQLTSVDVIYCYRDALFHCRTAFLM